jgi:hypothetical protein
MDVTARAIRKAGTGFFWEAARQGRTERASLTSELQKLFEKSSCDFELVPLGRQALGRRVAPEEVPNKTH